MTKGDLREEWKGIVEEFRGSGLAVAETGFSQACLRWQEFGHSKLDRWSKIGHVFC